MKIKILPDRIIDADRNESIMEALVRQQISVQNVCNGRGTCGKCKIRITEMIPPPDERERKHLQEEELAAGIRLACRVMPVEGMVIHLDGADKKDRKEAALLGLQAGAIDPGVKKIFLTLAPPSLQDERGDWDRIIDELKTVTGEKFTASLEVIGKASGTIRAGGYQVTAAVYDREILSIEAGDTKDRLYGAAVDIGTTSVAVALFDLTTGELLKIVSTENGQTAYGADVISRISFASEKRGNALLMQRAIQKTLNDLFHQLENKTKVSLSDILKITIVGNTTMHHLFTGLDVSFLAVAPYVSVCNRPLEFSAHDLNLEVNPEAKVYLLPNIGSFVGGDTLGAVIGAPEVLKEGNHLLIDLGTNCELFLKTDKIMLSCSTAAGPAFEGAGISNGMRARKGAIESVRLSANGVEFDVIGDQAPVGICGSGLIEGVDEMRKAGVINAQGRIGTPEDRVDLSPELRRRIRKTERGSEFVLADGMGQERGIVITQKDIASFQYAKGAVCAGIKTLVELAGLSVNDLDTVVLSGTFATYLKAENILNIGLVPDISREKIKAVGNAAHKGAVYTLLDRHQLSFAEELYEKISHVELGGSKTFSDYFMESMYLERME